MKRWLILAAASLFLTTIGSCGQDEILIQPTAPNFNLSTLTTQLPVDPGAFHNAVLAEMSAASIPPGSIENVTEFLMIFKAAVNNALAPYGPSRSVTKDECLFGLSVGRLVDPMYDLSFTDEQRADPVVVLDYWRQSELFSDAELDQVESLFAAPDPEAALNAAASIALDPESYPVGHAVSVFFASWDYWSTNGTSFVISGTGRIVHACEDPDDCVHELRVVLGDTFGGMIGGLIGGPIGAGLVAAGLSVAFTIDQSCWPDPCTGDTQLPPAPCGGYTGIGPCPD